MSNASANTSTLRLDLQRSKYCASVLLLQHGFTLLILALSPLSWILLSTLCLICLASLFHTLKHYAWHVSDKAVISLLMQHKQWCLILNDGQQLKAKLLGTSFSSHYLIVLNFRVVSEIRDVIPAKAGIQEATALSLDSRFRGNDNPTFLSRFDFQSIPCTSHKKISVLIMRDSLDPSSWRRLRGYLAFAKC